MKHRTVNDYFKQQWPRLILFVAFTLGVSFFAPLKNFQLKWLIDSKSNRRPWATWAGVCHYVQQLVL